MEWLVEDQSPFALRGEAPKTCVDQGKSAYLIRMPVGKSPVSPPPEKYSRKNCDYYLTMGAFFVLSPCRDIIGGPTETTSRLMGFP